MKDELKSPLSEIDSAAGQHAKRGGSAFAKAMAGQVRSHQRFDGRLAGGGGEAMLRVYSSRRPRVRRKGLKRGRGNGIIPL